MIVPPALMSSTRNKEWLMRLSGILTTGFLTGLLIVGQGTLLTTVVLAITICVVLIYSKTAAIYMSLGYVALLGDIRRVRDLVFPHPPLDLLILVTPFLAVVLALPLLLRLNLRDRLSKAMFWLLMLMVLEVFNPLQGGISVGFAGALFILVPSLWFWVGRQYGSPEVLRTFLYKVFLPLTIAAALLGLYQNFVGFLPWEQAWIDANSTTFTSLNLGGGNARSFGFSVSPAEYATFLGMGAAAAVATWFTRRRIWAIAFPFILTAMVLGGGRTVVVKLICTMALLFALRNSNGRLSTGVIVRLVVLMLVGLIGTSVVASRFAPSGDHVAKSTVQAALAHETGGLANPLDSKTSSATGHVQFFFLGILEGFRNPIGHGIGGTTVGAAQLGASQLSTEFDISDMFVTTGLFGGLIYLYCIFLTFQYCIRYVQTVPYDVSLPVLAIIVSGIGAWLIGGQYSTCTIWMFLIGCVAHEKRKPEPVVTRSTPRAGGLMRERLAN